MKRERKKPALSATINHRGIKGRGTRRGFVQDVSRQCPIHLDRLMGRREYVGLFITCFFSKLLADGNGNVPRYIYIKYDGHHLLAYALICVYKKSHLSHCLYYQSRFENTYHLSDT